MLKHILALIILSIVVILFLQQFSEMLHYVGTLHSWVADELLQLFSGSSTEKLISHVLALILIPLIIALIPAFFYWLIRRGEMPYLISITWVLWIIVATIIALR